MYLGGLAAALLVLAGTLAIGALEDHSKRPEPTGLTAVTDLPSTPEPAEPVVTEAPESKVASTLDEPRDKAGPSQRRAARRKRAAPKKSAPEGSSTILDPWK